MNFRCWCIQSLLSFEMLTLSSFTLQLASLLLFSYRRLLVQWVIVTQKFPNSHSHPPLLPNKSVTPFHPQLFLTVDMIMVTVMTRSCLVLHTQLRWKTQDVCTEIWWQKSLRKQTEDMGWSFEYLQGVFRKKEIDCKNGNWIEMAQEWTQWQALTLLVMNFLLYPYSILNKNKK